MKFHLHNRNYHLLRQPAHPIHMWFRQRDYMSPLPRSLYCLSVSTDYETCPDFPTAHFRLPQVYRPPVCPVCRFRHYCLPAAPAFRFRLRHYRLPVCLVCRFQHYRLPVCLVFRLLTFPVCRFRHYRLPVCLVFRFRHYRPPVCLVFRLLTFPAAPAFRFRVRCRSFVLPA